MNRSISIHRIERIALVCLCSTALSLALTSQAAQAAVFDLLPDASGKDTSPYSFIPSLVRGNYETMYALTSQDPDGTTHDQIAYLEFELPPDLLQPGETVLAASLFMVFSFTFDHDGAAPPPGGELYVHAVSSAWDEQTLSWNNKPGFGPVIDSVTTIDAFGSYEFDVTEKVRTWAHGLAPNDGFAVTNPTDTPIGFHTWESTASPSLMNRLVIVTGPGEPPALVPALGPVGLLGLTAALGVVGARRAARARA